jgi:hypothetical protein
MTVAIRKTVQAADRLAEGVTAALERFNQLNQALNFLPASSYPKSYPNFGEVTARIRAQASLE